MVDKRHNVRCAVNPQTLKELQCYKREKQLANIGAAIDRLVRKSSETNEALQMERQKNNALLKEISTLKKQHILPFNEN